MSNDPRSSRPGTTRRPGIDGSSADAPELSPNFTAPRRDDDTADRAQQQTPDPTSQQPENASETPSRMSPHFFRREPDGSVRMRIRFNPDEATLIEEAAGETPLLLYIHRVLNERARFHLRRRALLEAAAGTGLDDEDGDDAEEDTGD